MIGQQTITLISSSMPQGRNLTYTASERAARSTGSLKTVSLLADYRKQSLRILKDAMGLKPKESILIITDRQLFPLAGYFFSAAQQITSKARLMTIDIPATHGAEPHPDVALMMKKHEVCLLITIKSLTHTKATANAVKKGARIASMPGLTEGMFSKALSEKMSNIKKLNGRLIKTLQGKNTIRVMTKRGTNLTFSIKGREWVSDHGDFTKKGSKGNLPAGEIFIAPIEGTANGIYVIDGSIGSLGKIDAPVSILVENGQAVMINGKKSAVQYSLQLISSKHRNIAEFGIGTNSKARLSGELLEDEKVLGTCHIALGNNKHFGGDVDVPYHVDGILKEPTIYADGICIMRRGKLVG
jgi:aminopeptidase